MNEIYDWYGGTAVVATTEIAPKAKADLRIPNSAHEMVTRCSATLETNNFKQSECKWFESSQHHSNCMYDRFGIMCDKIIVNGEGVN